MTAESSTCKFIYGPNKKNYVLSIPMSKDKVYGYTKIHLLGGLNANAMHLCWPNAMLCKTKLLVRFPYVCNDDDI